ncbi:putative ribose/galactose/methyl galactoside import ATP-binding protein 1 [Vallitalea longa]|uniref:Ribose/galactose/methyl galactoside import ATP-binding protein 1 n=1 Tax=Vallitalea longa TaxID=2936439 RepID=A0A9W6DHJ7_9FIRM|nr:sugar ABC transporter ATP-binding protein [Vallitalea longa]GKX31533.1 putative ribose/galactose/methyl galactoside import ATP-binding protein 1 [Vallitalea longa]
MEYLLKASDISKSFPGVKALDNVNFDLKPGEVHVLLGENGAGKSTLIKVLAGIHKPDTGTIKYKDKEVKIQGPKHAQEIGIGVIYQELNLCHHLSVAENIFLGREHVNGFRLNRKKMIEESKKYLSLLQANINPKALVKDLTVSKRQMVEIAKTISMNADVIIMDEPTSSLSEKEVSELFEVIKTLKNQKKGIIYISHKMDELELIADRVSVFRDGTYIATKEYKDTNIDELISLMVGRSLDDKFPRVEVEVGEEILKVENINVKNLLSDINFSIREGEILGIAGLVGCGRTEMAKTIFGAIKKDSGNIYLNNKKVKINSPRDSVKNGILYVPEDRKNEGLAVNLSVADNIILPNMEAVISKKLGIKKNKSIKKISDKTVKDFNIKTPSINQKINNLSGGNQQKVVIGKWINKKPKVLIFDEPTRGIDVQAKTEIYKILNNLKKQAVGVVVISSELPELLGITDRILVMREGTISGELITKEATQEKIMNLATVN